MVRDFTGARIRRDRKKVNKRAMAIASNAPQRRKRLVAWERLSGEGKSADSSGLI
jgi:hypothetical protein